MDVEFRRRAHPRRVEGVEEIAFSPFDGALYVIRHDIEWKIERGTIDATGAWIRSATVYTSPTALSALIAPYTRYDDEERVFFARESAPGQRQILGVRRSGARPYEVTSPSALPAPSGTPASIHPVTGSLLWNDAAGKAHLRAWDPGTGNWGADEEVGTGEVWTWSPNGYYAVVWSSAGSVRFRHPDGTFDAISSPAFRAPPVSAANGRTLIGWTDAGLTTVSVSLPLAPVRYLTTAAVPDATRRALAREGIAVSDSARADLHEVQDDELYGGPLLPAYASVDDLLEVLHVGFQAVFVGVERDVSRPRLEAFLAALLAAGRREEEPRVREIASAAKRMLGGDYAFPEGERVLAETLAESELHQTTIDFRDFHPRGPYATSPELQHYFRAFKFIDRLALTAEERSALRGDERISVEPIRGVVDPVPAAWAQTARLLDALATAAKAQPATVRLAEVLAEAAGSATRLEGLARRQMADEPLAQADYDFVASFAGTVERLRVSLGAAGEPDERSAPESTMRIVGIHAWMSPRGDVQHWHAAVGRPRKITVLLGDRGVLVPGSGAVHSYHEVIADHRLDDDEWRTVVDSVARPAWANPSLPPP